MPKSPRGGERALGPLVLCGLLLLGCQTGGSRRATDSSGPNVVLVSIDTLRPDHLGCYDYGRPTSPNLDAFCVDSVVFRQVVAQAPSTLHSHASMLSSLLPHHHLASWTAKTRLPEEALTLAEVLKEAGYRTAAFTGGGQMDRVFGLDQGFESYVQPGEESFVGTVRRGIEWLDEKGDGRFFLFLHSYEVHHPYDPSPEDLQLIERDYDGTLPDEIDLELLREINREERQIDARDLAHIISTYDAEIRSMDDGFGLLIGALQERDLYDDTLVVFTSDHGEEFGEHGVVGWHSHSLYDELLLVPLVVKFPGSLHAASTVSAQVRIIDIPPTVLAALGLPPRPDFDGVDLAGLIGTESRISLVAISRMDRWPGRDISSVRTEDWKLYRNYLYQLSTDSAEQWDVAVSWHDKVAELKQELQEALAVREPLEAEQVVPSDATLDELRALGYLQ